MMSFYDPAMMDDLVPNIPLRRKPFLIIAGGFAVLSIPFFLLGIVPLASLCAIGAAAYVTGGLFVTKKQEADN